MAAFGRLSPKAAAGQERPLAEQETYDSGSLLYLRKLPVGGVRLIRLPTKCKGQYISTGCYRKRCIGC